MQLSEQVGGMLKPSTKTSRDQEPTPMQIGSLEDTSLSIAASLTEAEAIAPEHQDAVVREIQAVLRKNWKKVGPRGPARGAFQRREQGRPEERRPGATEQGAWRFRGKCHYCGKEGHRIRECKKKDADVQKGGLPEEHQ